MAKIGLIIAVKERTVKSKLSGQSVFCRGRGHFTVHLDAMEPWGNLRVEGILLSSD